MRKSKPYVAHFVHAVDADGGCVVVPQLPRLITGCEAKLQKKVKLAAC